MSTQTITHFSQLDLSAPLLQAIDEIGYETPSPIQVESIPPLLAGHDLLGQAQTGTGKTAAFALPLLHRVDISLAAPQALVLAPTRELAIQVAEAMQTYARHLPGFHVLPIYGGQDMGTQLRQLKRGVHVVVGTPGRIQDHLRRRTLLLDQIKMVVLDEADEMLRMGFIDDVDEILRHVPEQRQVALFSATMPKLIRDIAQRHLRNPKEVRIESKTATVSSISQRYWQVTGVHKLDALTRILETEEMDAMLIFVRTKTATMELAEKLEARGYSAAALNGDMNQALREQTVERIKNGALDIVIATDVAARGLDVERVSHVVNYDIPTDPEAYVHRIGRTGRAGRKGAAILFVSPREQRMLRTIERSIRQTITPMQLPTHEDVADRRITQFKQMLSTTIEAEELGFFSDIIASYQRDHNADIGEIAAALAFMVQRQRPLLPPKEKFHQRDEAPAREYQGRPQRDRDFSRERDSSAPPRRSSRPPATLEASSEAGMLRYRIDVGRDHGVLPKNIVGAIANEGGLDSRHIGQIKLYDSFSTVDLPEGMSGETFKQLQKVWVCGQQLRIRPLDAAEALGESGDAETGAAPKFNKFSKGAKPHDKFSKSGPGGFKPAAKPRKDKPLKERPARPLLKRSKREED